jgi:formylglycine-generating enzyme required for sulfatase activity
VNQYIRFIAVLLISAGLMQGAMAQFNVSGPDFMPDENGTNLDDPQAKKETPKVAVATVVKDCAECPEMVVIPAGSFVMGSDKRANEQPMHSRGLQVCLSIARKPTSLVPVAFGKKIKL